MIIKPYLVKCHKGVKHAFMQYLIIQIFWNSLEKLTKYLKLLFFCFYNFTKLLDLIWRPKSKPIKRKHERLKRKSRNCSHKKIKKGRSHRTSPLPAQLPSAPARLSFSFIFCLFSLPADVWDPPVSRLPAQAGVRDEHEFVRPNLIPQKSRCFLDPSATKNCP